MLNAVIRFALLHRPLIVIAAIAVLAYGSYLSQTLAIDVFPDLDRPRVTILCECHGLAAEEVETLVTFPIEAAMLGASGVMDVRSQSVAGFSSVVVEFDWNVELRQARQVVQERLATVVNDLPPEVRPYMAPPGALLGQIMYAGVRRQRGPRGGELAAIPHTSCVAEKVQCSDGNPQLKVWRVHDRHQPHAWEEVPAEAVHWERLPDGSEVAIAETVAGRYRAVFPPAVQREMELRTLADWVVRPRLLKTAGVAQVLTVGGGRKQYQVLVDPYALHEFGLTLQDVERAIQQNNLNASGGLDTERNVERAIRILGRLGPEPHQVLDELRSLPIRSDRRRPVLLEHVAQVVEAPQFKRGDASINGEPGVLIIVIKQPQADTRAVTARVQEALAAVEPSLPPDVVIERSLYQQRDFIDRGIYNVGEALVIGALLVIGVLFIFLLNVRTTIISLLAIPLSLAITAIVFRLVGALTGTPLSINIMTLGGLAVAIGELVDDSVVDVENIFRRLRQNAHAASPLAPLRVIYAASVEVRSTIVFGTLVVITVFLPLFGLSGMEGRLFTPLAVAYVTAILASLLVSLTLTPVLASYLLPQAPAVHRERDSLLVRGLKFVTARLVRFSMRHTLLLLLVSWLIVAYSAWRVAYLGRDFLPPFDEGTVQLTVSLPAGSSLEESNRIAAIVDRILRQYQRGPDNPDGIILSYARRSGRSELDEHADPPSETEYFITINPQAPLSRTEIIALIRDAVTAEIPGIEIEVEQPLAHLISHLISGSTAQIAIKVFGDDLNTLEKIAADVQQAIRPIDGVSTVLVERIGLIDEIHIRLDPAALAYYGVSREYVASFLQTALQGKVVSQIIEGQRRFDLLVRLEQPPEGMLAYLEHMHLELPDGRHLHLEQLARVTPSSGGDAGANQLKRENLQRRIIVRCNVQGRDLGSVVADIQRTVAATVPLPPGYFIEYGGQFENQQRATRTILILGSVAAVGIFLLLLMPLPSVRIVLQILNAIPTAFIGGVWALVLTGQTLTVASLVGFISLGGIAVRNSILLMNNYIHLMQHEGEGCTEQMVVRGALERMTPVLMTALTASMALLPLIVGGQQPGREVLYPVATVIFGGLLSATFCQFLIHPGVFWHFCSRQAYRIAQQRQQQQEQLL